MLLPAKPEKSLPPFATPGIRLFITYHPPATVWDTLEFRGFVWNNANGRGSNHFELVGTRDLLRQCDPDIPADSGRRVPGKLLVVKTGYTIV